MLIVKSLATKTESDLSLLDPTFCNGYFIVIGCSSLLYAGLFLHLCS